MYGGHIEVIHVQLIYFSEKISFRIMELME